MDSDSLRELLRATGPNATGYYKDPATGELLHNSEPTPPEGITVVRIDFVPEGTTPELSSLTIVIPFRPRQ